MVMITTAACRLEYGDHVNRRLATGTTPASVAVADGISPQVVAKAAWLARTYGPEARYELGRAVLAALAPSHLEVVAALDPGTAPLFSGRPPTATSRSGSSAWPLDGRPYQQL